MSRLRSHSLCNLVIYCLGLSFLFIAPGNSSDPQVPLEDGAAGNDSLFWGPYRPNLYFGVRPRLPKSLMTGLLWMNAENFATIQQNIRHTCEQHEGMAGYGWNEYDARNGGRQVIHDTGNKIDITIDFVKFPGGSKGGSWGARIKGNPRSDASSIPVTTLLFYAAMDGIGHLGFDQDESDTKGTMVMRGQSADLGDFSLDITSGKYNVLPAKQHKSWDAKPLDETLFSSMQVPPEAIWQGKHVILTNMKPEVEGYVQQYGEADLPPPWQVFTIGRSGTEGNFHITQKVLIGAFEFDIIFNTDSGKRITSESLTDAIPSVSKSFKEKYIDVFQPQPPFTNQKFTSLGESMLSNLVGGIGYFYGDSLVDRSYAQEYEEDNEGFWEETEAARAKAQISQDRPTELFTSVPSRPFFPRGFLWDEGFHLIPVVEWDVELTLEIVRSWFNLIDADGWIAREQILGPEARSKVPEEFQVQYPHYANPPTLFLIINILMDKLEASMIAAPQKTAIQEQLTQLYPLLKRQYEWFRRTQYGDIKTYDREAFSSKEAYRWRGRTPRHILTSGLDDYPRPQPPHPGELHTDLISWVGMMAGSLARVATVVGETDDAGDFKSHHKAIQRNIDDLHWSAKDKMYCDATIDDYEESVHVCHKGYISLFPFMTGLLPPSHPNLPLVLSLLSDPEELWSDYGIRSLSKTDALYGTDENYWRSPIWINMNYLILKNVLHVAQSAESPAKVKEQARRIYVDLRRNIVENVFEQWKDTGFAWEQYNPETGKGQRTQHFTGWTSLVVVMMKMPDLSGDIRHGEL